MFTGIIQHVGRVVSVQNRGGGRRLTIDLGPLADGLELGASVAVNGVCLTASGQSGTRADFDVVPETVERSTLGRLSTNAPVNLERSLRIGQGLDGHFVQGHIDGVATVDRRVVEQDRWELWFRAEAQVLTYLVPKGSVAIDGVSLTIARVAEGLFSVALIPTTLSQTTLVDRQPGDLVNVESDILVRTVVHTLGQLGGWPGGGAVDPASLPNASSPGLTEAKLREQGYR